MDDRRDHVRVEVATEAIVIVRNNPGISMTIESLSLGGARLAGPGTFDERERIQVLFEFDGCPIEVLAEVIRVEHDDILTDRIAVRFVSLDEHHRAALQQLVRRALDDEEERFADGLDDG